MSAIAIASCSLPSTSSAIAARIQAMSAPAQNDGPSPRARRHGAAAGSSASESRERRTQLRDERGIEGVVDVGRASVHPGDDAVAAGALDPQARSQRSSYRRAQAGRSGLVARRAVR
jgi:hypothetical protein